MTERNDSDMTDLPATSEKEEMAIETSPAALHDGTPLRCPSYSYLEPAPPTVVVTHLSLLVLSQDDALECHGRSPTPRQPIMPLAHNRDPWHARRPFPELHSLLQIPNFP
jgi:hypothetical protein